MLKFVMLSYVSCHTNAAKSCVGVMLSYMSCHTNAAKSCVMPCK